jgi:uncharacterized protein (DUF1684 family)
MKNSVFIAVIVLGIVMVVALYFQSKNAADKAYTNTIKKIRTEKDLFMATSPESPFGTQSNFTRLKYYEPDSKWKTTGTITQLDDTIPRFMAMTNKRAQRFIRYGFTDFKLNGQTCRLYLYIQPEDEFNTQHLFIPFTDVSNGKETYQGGRYIDVSLPKEGEQLQLDFNLAYNPYCVYNPSYVCPIPPSKNFLNIAIEAGEKKYDDSK